MNCMFPGPTAMRSVLVFIFCVFSHCDKLRHSLSRQSSSTNAVLSTRPCCRTDHRVWRRSSCRRLNTDQSTRPSLTAVTQVPAGLRTSVMESTRRSTCVPSWLSLTESTARKCVGFSLESTQRVQTYTNVDHLY